MYPRRVQKDPRNQNHNQPPTRPPPPSSGFYVPQPPPDSIDQPSSVTHSAPMSDSYAAYAPRPPAARVPDDRNAYMQSTYPKSDHMHSANHLPPHPASSVPASSYQPYNPASAGLPYNPNVSPHTSPNIPSAPMPHVPQPDFSALPADVSQQPMHSQPFQTSFYPVNPHQYQNPVSAPLASQPMMPQSHQSHLQQQPMPGAPPPQHSAAQSAVPVMMAGLQQMTAAAAAVNGGAPLNAALGAQLFQTLAPGAAGFTSQMLGEGQEKVKSFMRMPKYYFAVNHRYVLRKLSLILIPFTNRTWSRQRGIDPTNYGGSPSADGTSYLPPRDDVNAPDLYIPVMAFMTYVMVVGFVFGVRNAFKADILAKSFSKGLGLLTMEVLIIKLGLYLINARPTPWLDVIAYRGYKFVGVVLTIVLGLAVPRLHIPALLYSATAMGIFLMRSHRRIILPRDIDAQHGQDMARRNAFLLFLSVLQFPIYWLLARVVDIK